MGLLDDLEAKVSNAWNDISTTGAPAVIAALEQYGSDQLESLAKQSKAQAQAAVNQTVSSGQPSSGLMASINSVFGGVATNTFFHQYGAMLLIGAAVGYIVLRKVL